jgi:hypothetical protein
MPRGAAANVPHITRVRELICRLAQLFLQPVPFCCSCHSSHPSSFAIDDLIVPFVVKMTTLFSTFVVKMKK